ncbi:MAG: hypothetical protein WBD67_05480 [Terracidiphilus sp.]
MSPPLLNCLPARPEPLHREARGKIFLGIPTLDRYSGVGIPSLVCIFAHRVQWTFCLELALLAGAGGYFGAHLARRVNLRVMRWTITAIGFLTAGYFFLLNAVSHP